MPLYTKPPDHLQKWSVSYISACTWMRGNRVPLLKLWPLCSFKIDWKVEKFHMNFYWHDISSRYQELLSYAKMQKVEKIFMISSKERIKNLKITKDEGFHPFPLYPYEYLTPCKKLNKQWAVFEIFKDGPFNME